MSGPKVVRVVTREELLARALDQIAALERAIERFAAFGRRHDINLVSEIAAHRNAIAELRALTNAGAWNVIARRCADLTVTVDYDRKAREDELIAAATKEQTVRRRLKDAARSIKRETEARSLAVPVDLEDVIANVESATAAQLKCMYAAVAAAARIVVQHTAQSKSASDSALAKRLAAGVSQSNYADWQANNTVALESKKAVRLDRILAELRLRDVTVTAPVAAAIQRIQAAGDHDRDLLIDSLTVELGSVLKAHRQRTEDLSRLEDQIARLEGDGSREATELAATLRDSLSSGTASNLPDWERRANTVLTASRAKANAVHQRKALLSGLVALGYEVREGMATALVENGRLVVKKPAEVEYGIEIVSGATNARLQVRMVSFQSAANSTRDKDAEVIWCGEFSQLQAELARAGHTLEIEKALAPGTAPMKREPLPMGHDSDAVVDVKPQQARSL